jgi:NH3-dependent NAD+ synthetase
MEIAHHTVKQIPTYILWETNENQEKQQNKKWRVYIKKIDIILKQTECAPKINKQKSIKSPDIYTNTHNKECLHIIT